MRPLRRDQVRESRTYVLDCETNGLGEPVSRQASRGRPPRQLLCVLYDGRTYRRFWGDRAVQDAIEWVVGQDEDAEIFAHFGGGFDFRLAHEWLFREVKRRGSEWKVVTSGSLVIVCGGKFDGRWLRLIDSFRLLPSSLAAIGEAVGTRKLDWDHDFHLDAAWEGGKKRHRLHAPICYEDLAAYCERDCLVLWQGLDQMRRFASAQGVKLRATIASTASASIRLKLDLDTIAWAPRAVALACSRAKFGGRVQNFLARCGPGKVFDIQSSYPFAMLASLPWRYLETRDRYRRGMKGIVEATVEVPEGMAIPPLPYRVTEGRDRGRVFFPTGRWSGSFVSTELDYAVSLGCRIVDVQTFYRFEGSKVMAEFARRIWKVRANATGFLRYALKIWLNSPYGKLAEGEDHEEIVVHPPSEDVFCARHREQAREPGEGPCSCKIPIVPSSGLYAFESTHEPAFQAPWAAAAITAIGRVNLHKAMMQALALGGFVGYVDTDSVCTDADLPTGRALGDLSLEREFSSGRFLGPKMYAYECVRCDKKDRDGEPVAHPHDVVKAKGFTKLSRADFDRLDKCPCGSGYRRGTAFGCPECGGASLEEPGTGRGIYRGERSEGFKEALRRGRVEYRRIHVTRQLRETRPKVHPEGRPWSVAELSPGAAP